MLIILASPAPTRHCRYAERPLAGAIGRSVGDKLGDGHYLVELFRALDTLAPLRVEDIGAVAEDDAIAILCIQAIVLLWAVIGPNDDMHQLDTKLVAKYLLVMLDKPVETFVVHCVLRLLALGKCLGEEMMIINCHDFDLDLDLDLNLTILFLLYLYRSSIVQAYKVIKDGVTVDARVLGLECAEGHGGGEICKYYQPTLWESFDINTQNMSDPLYLLNMRDAFVKRLLQRIKQLGHGHVVLL